MKDFLGEYWKSAAAGAAGAFLLSLLVGLVTRNPFGVVFVRALLLAMLFAGLAAVLRYLVRTHLLESAKEEKAGSGGVRDDRRGGRVDIVLPEESPLGMEQYGSGRQESRPFGPEERFSPTGAGRGDDSVALDSGLGDMAGASGGDETASEVLGELAEEMQQSAEEIGTESAGFGSAAAGARSEGRTRSGTASLGGAADEDREDAAAEEESVESWSARTPEARNAASAPGVRRSDGSGPRASEDKDGLPDISNLEIAIEKDGEERGAAASSRPGGPRPEDALRGAVSGQDPATIARAIRTVLKREDKG